MNSSRGTLTEDDICWLKSDEACTLFVRGVVDLQSFTDACIAFEGCGVSQFNPPRHTWLRIMPGLIYREAVAGSRGAFPVTLMERPW